MKRAKKPRRAVVLAKTRGRVVRAAELFADCLGVSIGEALKMSGVRQ